MDQSVRDVAKILKGGKSLGGRCDRKEGLEEYFTLVTLLATFDSP